MSLSPSLISARPSTRFLLWSLFKADGQECTLLFLDDDHVLVFEHEL